MYIDQMIEYSYVNRDALRVRYLTKAIKILKKHQSAFDRIFNSISKSKVELTQYN
jgi:hypothetical protein